MSETQATYTATPTPATPAPVRTVPTPYELLQRLKAADPAFAAAAAEKGRFRVLPPHKLMRDLARAIPGAEDELIRDRFLCRGGCALLAAQSGKGKSSLARQIALYWAAGLPAFGFAPARPLRQLILQAENDEGDEAAFRDGAARCPYAAPGGPEEGDPAPLPPEVLNAALGAVFVARCDDQTGDGFLATLDALLEEIGPVDLVWVDPLLAYLGADASDQEVVSRFCRNGLQPLIRRRNIGLILIHHTPKPLRQPAKTSAITDIGAYLGAGSAELTNWPRAVITLENTNHRGVFRLRAPKRGMRLGWTDAEGVRTDSRYLAHATDGAIYWREPTAEELEEATYDPDAAGKATRAPKVSVEMVVEVIEDAGGAIHYTPLLEGVQAAAGCSRSTAAAAVKKAVDLGVCQLSGTCPTTYRTTGKPKKNA